MEEEKKPEEETEKKPEEESITAEDKPEPSSEEEQKEEPLTPKEEEEKQEEQKEAETEEEPAEEPEEEKKEEPEEKEEEKEAPKEEKKEEHKIHHKPKHRPHHPHHKPKKYPISPTHILLALVILVLAITIFKAQTMINSFDEQSPGADTQEPVVVEPEPEKQEVTITHLTADCEDCVDLTLFTAQLNQFGIKTTVNEVDGDSEEGQTLIDKYELDKLPTLLFSEELGEYPDVSANWEQVGSIEDDGTYILRMVAPPFVELESGKVRGLVTLTYIVDESCEDCYDVNQHKTVLEGFGMKFEDEQTSDISEEEVQELLEEYNITKVPTIVLSEDASYYEGFDTVWQSVGDITEDGTYVFRKVEVMGKYKDLETDEIVEPPGII